MAEQPVSPPQTVTVVNDQTSPLEAARSNGGHAFVAAADAIIAAGGTLSYAQQRDVKQVRDAIARSHDTGGALSERDAYKWAQQAAAKGTPPEQITAVMRERGLNWQPGVETWTNTEDYYFEKPAGLPATGFADLDSDAREFCGTLGMEPSAGNNFVRTVLSASNQLDAPGADRAAVVKGWEARLEQLFPGAKLTEAKAIVDEYLKQAGNSRLAARMKEHDVTKEPFVFNALYWRARAASQA